MLDNGSLLLQVYVEAGQALQSLQLEQLTLALRHGYTPASQNTIRQPAQLTRVSNSQHPNKCSTRHQAQSDGG